MSFPATGARLLCFDNYELDLHAGELRKHGIRLRLQGQPLQLLTILLRYPGELVTRETLRNQLWPADTFVDFDHGLHNAVGRIREVLEDSAEQPRYVETLPRRGYRFVGQVETQPSLPVPAPPAELLQPEHDGVSIVTGLTRRARWLVLAAVCYAIGLGAWGSWRYFHSPAPVPIRSIAVLPMVNLSGDPTQEYFADGMTEELITELSRVHALKVISRTSVMEYKGTRKHLPQIASELGVEGIVEGSVSREGNQVRITVQLLDGRNDRHLWGANYEHQLQGILLLQRQMAEAIAHQIRIELAPQQQARGGTRDSTQF